MSLIRAYCASVWSAGWNWLVVPPMCLAAAMSIAGAQDVAGVVSDSITGAPIRGAVVTVLDAGRRQLARGLTSSSGTFRMPRGTGTIIRVIRIGYMPSERPLDSATTRLTITMHRTGRLIAAVSVRANPVCPRRSDQDQALALWSAATDALLALVVASEDSSHNGLVTQLLYTRRVDGNRIVWQSTRRAVTGNVSPIRADRDPQDFVEEGYVVQREGGYTYFAPDPEVLLDSSFAVTHCLSIRNDGEKGLTGVVFTPTHDRRNRADIAGTLWLSRAPLALHSLDFEYRGVPRAILEMHAGGRIEFVTPSDDVPFISRWHVRSPRVREMLVRGGADNRGIRREPFVIETYESGGLIADGDLADGTNWSTPLSTLRGTIRNADDNQPVRDARVTFDSTDQSATTDSLGNFSFAHLLPGPHVLRVRDSIAIHSLAVTADGELVPDTLVMQHVTRNASRTLEIRPGRQGPIQFRLPWRAPVNGCGQHMDERRFVVLGTVRGSDGSLAPNVPVRLSWVDTEHGTRIETVVDTHADATGAFTMCGIPADRPLTTRVVGSSGKVHTGTSRLSGADRSSTGPISRTTRSLHITIPAR